MVWCDAFTSGAARHTEDQGALIPPIPQKDGACAASRIQICGTHGVHADFFRWVEAARPAANKSAPQRTFKRPPAAAVMLGRLQVSLPEIEQD
jgi:hypothetical protein